MASIRKRGTTWQAIVDRGGIYKSGTFPTKIEAQVWASALESEILLGRQGHRPANKTLGQLLEKYSEEVTPKKEKDPAAKEQQRIKAMLSWPIAKIKLADLNDTHVVAWRDWRLQTVSGSSVNRDWNTLSRATQVAMKEWKWLPSNPFRGVERPEENESRDRLATQAEIDKMIFVSGYQYDKPPATIIQRVMAITLFAMQTAMRCKEMIGLKWSMVHLDKRYVEVGRLTKTGRRHVPLSKEAIRILEQMKEVTGGDVSVFNLTSSQRDANFRKITSKADIEDLTFHDSKHYACTKLAKKVHVLDLARIVGTKDLKTLSTYYNKSASDIAFDLD